MVAAIFFAVGAIRPGENFLKLSGEPLLSRTLKIFSESERVKFLIVIVGEDEVEPVKKILDAEKNLKPYKIIVGENSRQKATAEGLKFLPEDTEIILTHDALHPAVSLKTIEDVIDGAEKFGAAAAAVPEKNTIKISDENGFVVRTQPRFELMEFQPPQGFRKEILLRAYAKAEEENFFGEDDAHLVEELGEKIKVIHGDYRNIKTVTPEDVLIAESFFEE